MFTIPAAISSYTSGGTPVANAVLATPFGRPVVPDV